MTTLTRPVCQLAPGTAHPVSGDLIACSDPGRLESAAIAAIRDTPALLEEGRGWIVDAYSLDPEDFHPAVMQTVGVIHRHYDGGCISFYLNSLQLTSNTTRKA